MIWMRYEGPKWSKIAGDTGVLKHGQPICSPDDAGIDGPALLGTGVGQDQWGCNDAEGVRLTHQGLQLAVGSREEEAALSNLCAGYIKLGLYDNALKYCNLLLGRNDRNWRGYNNRAVIYIKTKQWDKADKDLERGEELHPNARTLKIARSMYMDAVHPVAPEIEIDDRQRQISAETDPQ
jgi:tetratricopeptide (TPR) repeat protein